MGCSVKYPKLGELFIDIDDAESLALFERNLPIVKEFYPGAKETRRTPSPSGREGRFHIVVDLYASISNEERLTLQAILGSDPKREILGHHHIKAGEERPTRFFEKKTGSKARKRSEIA